MERELKAKLDEAIDAALIQWRKEREVGKFAATRTKNVPKPVLASTETVLASTKTALASAGPKAVQRFVVLVRNKLRRGPFWKQVQRELIAEMITHLLSKTLANEIAATIDGSQMTLPGFEHLTRLPKRVGRKPLPAMTLKAVFAFAKRYEKKWDRDNQTMTELRALTEYVKPVFEYDPSLSLEDAIAETKAKFPHRAVPVPTTTIDAIQ